jgi:hypothetical protein
MDTSVFGGSISAVLAGTLASSMYNMSSVGDHKTQVMKKVNSSIHSSVHFSLLTSHLIVFTSELFLIETIGKDICVLGQAAPHRTAPLYTAPRYQTVPEHGTAPNGRAA